MLVHDQACVAFHADFAPSGPGQTAGVVSTVPDIPGRPSAMKGAPVHRLARSLSLTAALALTASAITAGAAVAAPAGRSSLAGSQPSWAKSSALKAAAPTTDYVGIRVYLGWRDQGAAENLALSVTTPG